MIIIILNINDIYIFFCLFNIKLILDIIKFKIIMKIKK